MENPDMKQDHKKGPGWFLILSYIVIAVFCVYYLFAYIDWKSDYDRQLESTKAEVAQEQM
jgi:hypothetical protein